MVNHYAYNSLSHLTPLLFKIYFKFVLSCDLVPSGFMTINVCIFRRLWSYVPPASLSLIWLFCSLHYSRYSCVGVSQMVCGNIVNSNTFLHISTWSFVTVGSCSAPLRQCRSLLNCFLSYYVRLVIGVLCQWWYIKCCFVFSSDISILFLVITPFGSDNLFFYRFLRRATFHLNV